MRHLTIGLLTPSVIQSVGLTHILRKIQDVNLTIIEISTGDYIHELARTHPSVLIVDPMSPDIDWDLLKSASSHPVKLIAVLNSQLPHGVKKWFDDSFSIYDSEDVIFETVKRNIVIDKTEDKGRELSPREKEVIVGIVKGLSNKEIATEMCVSVNTVMTHRRNIASKLHIHTPAGLTIYAIVSNLVKLEDIKADMNRL